MTPVRAVALKPRPFPPRQADWRAERLLGLMGDDWLAGEWDPELQLVLPAPGGRLTRVLHCAVPGCENDGYTSTRLCTRHRHEFDASESQDLESWLASGEPVAYERRRGSDRACVVRSADGLGCPRPAHGPWQLCDAHDSTWWKCRRKGATFEDFLARAVPLEDLGGCTAACCWRKANYPENKLCVLHAQLWRAGGRPVGRAFSKWAAQVRQPEDARVLSLRGVPELVRLELLYAIGCRATDQVAVTVGSMRPWVDQLRAERAGSVTEFDLSNFDDMGDRPEVRFARFCVDRVSLAYADPEHEREKDTWDLRLFGRPGRLHLDFSAIRQDWLKEAAKGWAVASLGRVSDGVLAHRVGSVAVLSAVLASGPGGGRDPASLGRGDVERFLARVRSPKFPRPDKPFGTRARASLVEECAQVLREARELGLLPTLGATFAFRRGDRLARTSEEPPGRALPVGVVAQLDANLDLLASVPGAKGQARVPTLGALGEHAGEMAVLVYELLKGTGQRVGEVASLHLECLDVDEHGRDVLVYDNHKAARLGRRLPLAESALVKAIRAQQAWVRSRFPPTPLERLWLLPRPHKNADGTKHFDRCGRRGSPTVAGRSCHPSGPEIRHPRASDRHSGTGHLGGHPLVPDPASRQGRAGRYRRLRLRGRPLGGIRRRRGPVEAARRRSARGGRLACVISVPARRPLLWLALRYLARLRRGGEQSTNRLQDPQQRHNLAGATLLVGALFLIAALFQVPVMITSSTATFLAVAGPLGGLTPLAATAAAIAFLRRRSQQQRQHNG